jgi:hypothetical protein
MRSREHDDRLLSRNEQTRSWTAPVPDFTVMPRVGTEPSSKAGWYDSSRSSRGAESRIRVEWDTRDSVNNRLWADTMAAGAKTVTSAMLAEHQSAGAETMMPSAGRQDYRHYHESSAHIGAPMRVAAGGAATGLPGMLERPGIPRAGVWFDTAAMDTSNAIRDVRGVIRENNMGRGDDAAARIQERVFQNQWMTPDTLRTIVDARLGAAESLRPRQDDWRKPV